jgi:hypothetical protein
MIETRARTDSHRPRGGPKPLPLHSGPGHCASVCGGYHGALAGQVGFHSDLRNAVFNPDLDKYLSVERGVTPKFLEARAGSLLA